MVGVIEPDRAQAAEEVEPLAQVELRRHLDPGGQPHIGQSHRAQQNGIVLLALLERFFGERIAATQALPRPSGELVDLELHAVQP